MLDPVIFPPYYDEEDNYHLRLYVNFIQDPGSPVWITQQEADASAETTFQVLNDAYNQHGIYFTSPGLPCSAPTATLISSSTNGGQSLLSAMPSAKHDDGIDIYVFEDTTAYVTGSSVSIPSTYFSFQGLDGGQLANETTVVVHELGHVLGLQHTHENKCDLTACPYGLDSCYCTGDYVCDTDTASITSTPLPCATSALAKNYMSYSDNLSCRDHFTTEQVQRMRAHLSGHDSLQNFIIPPLVLPGDTLPSGPSNSIVVDSGELHITSTLEMLPGAYIWVKPGATLRVSAKITGACGEMWRGVIVQGDDQPQLPVYQGRVIVDNNGIIEHAVCGIEAGAVGGNGVPFTGPGGGIVQATGGTFNNNVISIRFGPYLGSNVSYISYGNFYTTNDYRGSTSPTHLEANRVSNIRIDACEFKDLRTFCSNPGSRATGIHAMDASFRASSLCRFENLYFGILSDRLITSTGTFTVFNSRFDACHTGIFTRSNSDFSIEGNDFLVKAPDSCEATEATGVHLFGTTAGFSLKSNYFHYNEATFSEDSLIGVKCVSLEEGVNNEIRNNIYENMVVAHLASGNNGFSMDGLVYLCDSVTISYSEIPETVMVKDFQVTADGSIREDQEDVSDQGQRLPTGNAFSGQGAGGYSFQNLGPTVNYLFYEDSDQQDPENTDFGPVGINPEATDDENTNCFTNPEPCAPPCKKEDLDQVKEDFRDKKGRWQEHKAAYLLEEDEEEQATILDSITFLRRAMNRDARLILMTHSLDTVAVEADSILTWLELTETYPTDYRRARHYFFTGEFGKFDSLWADIPERYALDDDQTDEFDEIETVLDIIRPDLDEGGLPLSQLPEATLDSLMAWKDVCTEPGALAQAVLWRNGRRVVPDCGGEASRPGGGPVVSTEEAEEDKPSPVKLYPNPSRGSLTLELPPGHGPATLVFYSLQGKPLLQQSFGEGIHTLSLPKGQFQPGLYLAEIVFSSGQRERFKLILTQ